MEKNYLWEKLGSTIQEALQNDEIFEIMLNPDGKLWLKHQKQGNIFAGTLNEHAAGAFAHAIAHFQNKYLNSETPYLDATLPFNGERVNITIPPITDKTSFNIRKKAKLVYTLNDYIDSKIMSKEQARILTKAIRHRKNILVSGSPASGKTTFTNALIDFMAKIIPPGQRVLLLEQVTELQCSVKNVKAMLTSDGIHMNTLLWIAMRSSPDRIIIGEVRDSAALDMLKAWNTGCPGGIATIHANNPQAAIQRVLDLSCEAITNPPYTLAAEALDLIVQIKSDPEHPAGRKISSIVQINSFENKTGEFQLTQLDNGGSNAKFH